MRLSDDIEAAHLRLVLIVHTRTLQSADEPLSVINR